MSAFIKHYFSKYNIKSSKIFILKLKKNKNHRHSSQSLSTESWNCVFEYGQRNASCCCRSLAALSMKATKASKHILDVAITQRCLRTDCRLTTDVPHTLILTEQPADFPAKMPFQTMHINLLTRTHVSS